MNTRKINELPVLQQASEETNVLVEQNGVASRVPAAVFSGDRLIEKIAPAFTKTGAVVTCNPVEGCPLEVVSHLTGGNNLITDYSTDINNYDDPTIALELPAGEYILYSNFATAIRVAANNQENILVDVDYSEGGLETTFTHPGGTLLIIDMGWTGELAVTTLTLTAASAEFTSVSLIHNGETITAELPQGTTGGTFNWTTGVLSVPTGNPNLISGEVACRAPEDDDGYGEPVYYLPHLPTGTYTIYVEHELGYSLDVEFDDFGQWVKVVTANSGEAVTFEVDEGQHPRHRLRDTNWSVTDGPFTVVKLEEGTEYTSAGFNTTQLTSYEIVGAAGVNTLQSSTGNTQVSGKADPSAAFAEQEARIAALEAALLHG